MEPSSLPFIDEVKVAMSRSLTHTLGTISPHLSHLKSFVPPKQHGFEWTCIEEKDFNGESARYSLKKGEWESLRKRKYLSQLTLGPCNTAKRLLKEKFVIPCIVDTEKFEKFRFTCEKPRGSTKEADENDFEVPKSPEERQSSADEVEIVSDDSYDGFMPPLKRRVKRKRDAVEDNVPLPEQEPAHEPLFFTYPSRLRTYITSKRTHCLAEVVGLDEVVGEVKQNGDKEPSQESASNSHHSRYTARSTGSATMSPVTTTSKRARVETWSPSHDIETVFFDSDDEKGIDEEENSDDDEDDDDVDLFSDDEHGKDDSLSVVQEVASSGDSAKVEDRFHSATPIVLTARMNLNPVPSTPKLAADLDNEAKVEPLSPDIKTIVDSITQVFPARPRVTLSAGESSGSAEPPAPSRHMILAMNHWALYFYQWEEEIRSLQLQLKEAQSDAAAAELATEAVQKSLTAAHAQSERVKVIDNMVLKRKFEETDRLRARLRKQKAEIAKSESLRGEMVELKRIHENLEINLQVANERQEEDAKEICDLRSKLKVAQDEAKETSSLRLKIKEQEKNVEQWEQIKKTVAMFSSS